MAEQNLREENNSLRIGPILAFLGIIAVIWVYIYGTSDGIISRPDKEYDFIIVGGGTAGCVLASRLSEDPYYKVLLIEAGGEEPWISSIPLAAPLLQRTSYDWKYRTVPQKNSHLAMHNHESFWPRGKVLGGSGQINYNIHSYGSPKDIETWEKDFGVVGWNFHDIRKYSLKAECKKLKPNFENSFEFCPNMENSVEEETCQNKNDFLKHQRRNEDYVQCSEPPLSKTASKSILSDAFLKAGRELGLPIILRSSESTQEGIMAAENNIHKGRRWNTASGYLRPILGKRKNLHVVVNTRVTKIIWEGIKAVGVEYILWENSQFNGTTYAKGEIILSAGTINTPEILLRSGVGPKKILQKLKVKSPIAFLEGVGNNLQDHLNLPLYVSLRSNVSLNMAKLKSMKTIWDYFVHGKGPLTEAATEGVAIAVTNTGKVDVGLTLFSMGSVDKDLFANVANIKREKFDLMFPGMESEKSEGFILLASCLHPKSRGFVTFVSGDEMDPVIEPNYLQHPYDLECMRQAFWFAKNISQTSSLKAMGAQLRLPRYEECTQIKALSSTDNISEEYINCIIKTSSITAYHPIGTARMGKAGDPEAVVDSKLRVHGVERLRVVDASVLPSQISGFPNSVVIIIAEKASDLIKMCFGYGSKKLNNEKICSTSSVCEDLNLKHSEFRNDVRRCYENFSRMTLYVLFGIIMLLSYS